MSTGKTFKVISADIVSMTQNHKPPRKDKSVLPALLRRYGVVSITIVVTLLSVMASVIVTSLVLYLMDGRISLTGVLISIFVPLVLVPISSYSSHKLVHRLDMAEERLRRLSNTDELTGAFNRRYFFEQAGREFERAKRYEHTFSIAILDFDNFKDVNDGYSHLAGDAALKQVAEICQSGLRQMDVFARYGGDEFVFLFPDTNLQQAKECLDRIIAQVHDIKFQYDGQDVTLRASVGLADFHTSMRDLNDILREADFALYAAKRQGGMQVLTHPT